MSTFRQGIIIRNGEHVYTMGMEHSAHRKLRKPQSEQGRWSHTDESTGSGDGDVSWGEGVDTRLT